MLRFSQAIGIIVAAFATACCGSPATRAEARAAVLVSAEPVKVLDTRCAALALDTRDIDLARRCEVAYDQARTALVVAATGVDAWEEGKKGEVACAVARAVASLDALMKEMRGEMPAVALDALTLYRRVNLCTTRGAS